MTQGSSHGPVSGGIYLGRGPEGSGEWCPQSPLVLSENEEGKPRLSRISRKSVLGLFRLTLVLRKNPETESTYHGRPNGMSLFAQDGSGSHLH